jgi:DNA repair exonuclease SbcCD ATPase subunit
MKLLEFSYKNILSYGNLLQRFQFDDAAQLILVEGENGAGKSSIKEALTVSLYGRSAIRKMKDIPNWINKNAYTNVKFVTNTGEEVEISRGIEPNFSDIKINGANYNLPDKRKVDEFIEDELAKIPFSVFCNTISLSFDDFKSFVNLSQGDKRKIVDRIFGIDILSDMRTVVKEDLKQGKKEIEIINSQIEKNTTTLTSSMEQLIQLKEKISKKKDLQTEDLKDKIKTKKTELLSLKEEYLSFKTSIDDFQKKLNGVRDEISKIKSAIESVTEKLELYQKNRCPHCLNDLTNAASIKTKDAIEAKKKMLEVKLPELQLSFTNLTEKLNELTEDQNTSKIEYYKLNAEIEQLVATLKKTVEDLGSDQTESIEAIIATINTEISTDLNKISSKNEEINLFTILDELLSDSGIKKTLIDKIIPTLNNRILEISKQLEFKFQFEFDSEFNPIITYLGMEVSPESLSSGQRKKMNLIVLLAFIEIIKMKHSQMNIMFLDEIFSSLDKNNVYKAIEILKEYAHKYKMTIFVVSHEALPEEFFNYKIFVKTKDHFSEMQISKVGKIESL